MSTRMMTIDGSAGEGGGQVLRTSLTLAALTGRPCRLENIRAGRDKPGLMRQHLTAVQALARICRAQVDGGHIGSQSLTFTPGPASAGQYEFAVGTAGSTTLVLQTILLPLALADGPSRVIVEGGTHNPMAPPFDFLARSYLPLLERTGPRIDVRLERAGFFPAGGGRIVVDIEPTARLTGFDLVDRGEVRARRARVLISNLPRHIGEREVKVLRKDLPWPPECIAMEQPESAGPGNVVIIEYACTHVTEVFTGFGEVRLAAEAVARRAVRSWRAYRGAGAAAGEYLTDQLVLPLAVAGRGSFTAQCVSRHTRTHIDLIERFLDIRVAVEPGSDSTRVTIG